MKHSTAISIWGLACVVVATIGTTLRGDDPTTAPARLRVLFIGNSLTASNDLPAMVQAMARLRGVELRYEACTPGGASLEDHWNDGHCRRLLEGQQWDFVVLQQGPSSRDDSRANLKEWSARWADAIRARGARPALYMVWPQLGQKDGFKRVGDSYRMAADASRSILLPAGDAWRAAIEMDQRLPLYLEDGLHPTEEGTYLAALVVTSHIAEIGPADVPNRLQLASGNTIVVAPEVGAVLRAATSKVTKTKTP
jgi:lysophospholipase L1-like esterase